jgi:hypothetical protein
MFHISLQKRTDIAVDSHFYISRSSITETHAPASTVKDGVCNPLLPRHDADRIANCENEACLFSPS